MYGLPLGRGGRGYCSRHAKGTKERVSFKLFSAFLIEKWHNYRFLMCDIANILKNLGKKFNNEDYACN